MQLFFALLLIWNILVFFLFALDKRRAIRHQWRIAERTLILCSLLGGGAGALAGMHLLRHKTNTLLFRIVVPLAFVLQLAALGAFVWYFGGLSAVFQALFKSISQ